MEKNPNEDIESYGSFEMFDAIPTDSMSIVAITESMPENGVTDRSHSFNIVDNQLITRPVTDSLDGLPNYDQITAHDTLAQTISTISDTTVTDERNASLKTLSDTLERISNNPRNSSSVMSSDLSNNLEIYLKELKTENESLRSQLEKNNLTMRQQLKNLHEWQNKNKELIEEHKQMVDNSKQVSEENQRLKEEIVNLKEQWNRRQNSESNSIQHIEELTKEVEELRLKCLQMGSYEKFDISSELKTQELTSGLVESQLRSDALMQELKNRDHMITTQQQQLREAQIHLQAKDNDIAALQQEMNASNHKLDAFTAMEMQINVFERDFKIAEMKKLAAFKEVEELKEEIEQMKKNYSELEERIERGDPMVDLQEEKPVGKHHRKHRRERLGRRAIPVLSVGAVLKGFKQYRTTSDNV